MSVLVIEDHALFRDGLRSLLENLPDPLPVVEVLSCEEALDLPEPEHIELVLADLTLPGLSGLDAVRRLIPHFSEASVVVLSGVEDIQTMRLALAAGAAGFIPKSSPHHVVCAALALVRAGGIYVPRQAAALVDARDAPAPPADPRDGLSDRQRETLGHAMAGLPNKRIARAMGIAETTVKAHLAAAYRHLGVSNRTQAMLRLRQTEPPRAA